MRSLHQLFFALLASVVTPLLPGALSAGEIGTTAPASRPAEPGAKQVVHRVTGLFSPDREADLRLALQKIPGVELVSIDFDFSEATFAYDAAKAFPDTKEDKIIERFDQLLLGATHRTMRVKPRILIPRDKLVRVEIPITLLDCKACCLGLYEMLESQDGVVQATASYKDHKATVLIDPSQTDRAKLIDYLKKHEVTVDVP